MSNRIPAAAARKNFAEVIKRSSDGERIKLTRYDKTLAVLIPKKDLKALEECEGEEPEASIDVDELIAQDGSSDGRAGGDDDGNEASDVTPTQAHRAR